MELTFLASLAGYRNSTAANSPELLLRWNRRGVKLNLPGSEGRRSTTDMSKEPSTGRQSQLKTTPAYLVAYSRKPSCPASPGAPRRPQAPRPHRIP